jgi:hypothetical protein
MVSNATFNIVSVILWQSVLKLFVCLLQGSFRIYGAKTSRQVFLFEKGVLIGKRKEDGMLSCRVMIQELYHKSLSNFIT